MHMWCKCKADTIEERLFLLWDENTGFDLIKIRMHDIKVEARVENKYEEFTMSG